MKSGTGSLRPRTGDVLFMHGLILLHSLTSVVAKVASRSELTSPGFIGLYAVELAMFAVYAFLWQKVLKRFDLSTVVANTGMYIVWTLCWAALLFGEPVALNHIIGAVVVVLGIVVMFVP